MSLSNCPDWILFLEYDDLRQEKIANRHTAYLPELLEVEQELEHRNPIIQQTFFGNVAGQPVFYPAYYENGQIKEILYDFEGRPIVS